MIQTKQLSYFYQKDKTFNFPDISINGGENLLILGQSGIGKTTLLHLLGGLMKPKKGSIIVGGKDITKMSDRSLDSYRGKNISIIFQQNHFVKSLSVIENLSLSLQMSGERIDVEKTKSYLDQLNIIDKKDKFTHELSQGEKQRVAIVRSLINNPRLILADEPTSALDDRNTEEVASLLVRQAKDVGAALLVVTHDARLNKYINQSIELS